MDELTVFGHDPGAARRTSDPEPSTEAMIGPETSGDHSDDDGIKLSDSDYLPVYTR